MNHRYLQSGLVAVVVSAGWVGLCRAESKPVAKIGDTVLTEDQMKKEIGMQLYQAQNTVYTTQRAWVDQKAMEILFDQAAKEAKLSRAKWEAKEIDAKAAPVDQARALQLAQQSTRPGMSSTETLKQVNEYMTAQSKQARRLQVYQELVAAHPIEVLLAKPEAPVINVPKGVPVLGPENAPVTIIEYTDFQCPWCKRSQESLQAVKKTYGDQVRLVARQFPLTSIHPRAFPASEAALCAHEQGKFWEYHDKLFESAPALEDADFKRVAKAIKLNEAKFNQCIAQRKTRAQVDADLADGQTMGVRGTPAFFVNGTQTNFQQLSDAVRDELARKK